MKEKLLGKKGEEKFPLTEFEKLTVVIPEKKLVLTISIKLKLWV